MTSELGHYEMRPAGLEGPDLRDLYIGSVVTDYVVHVRSPVPGMPLVHQRVQAR
jgi:gluconolactonase